MLGTNLRTQLFPAARHGVSRSFHTSPLSMATKPTAKPACPNFSSGPTAKPPGYHPSKIPTRTLGRSHRAAVCLNLIKDVITKHKSLLGIPQDYLCAIVPASDTGAYEMAMWNLLGQRPVDMFHWESFGKGWVTDAQKHLKLKDVNVYEAAYGELPDLSKANKDHDICFTWNGTTSGVCLANADWISADRTGLTLCDATSAVFSMPVEWSKCDVTTWSWQKALGGEGAHGMLVLSPAAIDRLLKYDSGRPLPKIFRMVNKGKLDDKLFEGSVINTISMMAVEDCLIALDFAERVGGLEGMVARSKKNLALLEEFVNTHDWINFLAKDPAHRSSSSICFSTSLSKEGVKKMTSLLEKEGVAYDIGSYRDAPPGLRIWGGPTVESSDIEALLPWLEYAYHQSK